MKFKYKGFNAQGHERAGSIEANSHEDAAGKLRSEHGLFINTLEPDDSPARVPPPSQPVATEQKPSVEKPLTAKPRTLNDDLDKGMEVIRLLKQAKLPKKLLERAKEEMVLCLVRKAMLK
jgi:type II secretory pathway component PulF